MENTFKVFTLEGRKKELFFGFVPNHMEHEIIHQFPSSSQNTKVTETTMIKDLSRCFGFTGRSKEKEEQEKQKIPKITILENYPEEEVTYYFNLKANKEFLIKFLAKYYELNKRTPKLEVAEYRDDKLVFVIYSIDHLEFSNINKLVRSCLSESA
mgnify:CR=1 FL=1|jgi:hypothetical protein